MCVFAHACAFVYNVLGLAVVTLSKSLYPHSLVYIAENWLQLGKAKKGKNISPIDSAKNLVGSSLYANTTPVVLSMSFC